MIEYGVIENLLKSCDIVNVISSYIHVIKKGRSYVAICPFHDDKHPSLHISREKQIYKCFSCGEGGNAITFIQNYEKIGFEEAVRKLADLVGYYDPRLAKPTYIKKVDPALDSLYKCINDLQAYYRYSLSTKEGEEARNYLTKRGLNEEDIEKYGLGYAPSDGKKTIQYLQAKGHSLKAIEDIGITLAKATGSSDNNASRLIFPLFDSNGQVVGFSARRLKDDDSPKYVNTPETKIFHKGEVLYNYHNAKKNARHDGYVYVLEGFMDTIALNKAGIGSAVALMGTNLTKEHIGLLRKLGSEVRLCLDGDDPGQMGMMKAIGSLQKSGLPFRLVLNASDERDPDDIYQEDGAEALKKKMDSLVDPFEFQLSYYLHVKTLSTIEEKQKALNHFLPFLARTPAGVTRDDYINKLAKATGYLSDTIREQLRAYSLEEANEVEEFGLMRPKKAEKSLKTDKERRDYRRLYNAERQMLICMIESKEAIDYFTKNIDNFFDPVLNELANIINEMEPGSVSVSKIIAFIEALNSPNKKELEDELLNIDEDAYDIPLSASSYEEIGKAIKKAREDYNAKREREKEYRSASSDEDKISIALKRSQDIVNKHQANSNKS